VAHDSGTALLLMSDSSMANAESVLTVFRITRTTDSIAPLFSVPSFTFGQSMGKGTCFFLRKTLPALERPSSKVLHQTYHRPTLPERYRLCSVDHVVEPLAMEDLEEEGLLGQRIKLMYQDEETVVIDHAITLISVGHDQV
jgi:hypothetical protein